MVIVQSINNFDPLPMATDIINLWGVGKDDKGILLLVAVDDRSMAFATGYAVEELFPDILTKKISEEEMVPYFKTNQHAKGILSGVTVIRNIIMDENIPSYVEETLALGKNQKRWQYYMLIVSILIIALTIFVHPKFSTIMTIGIILFAIFVISIISYGILIGNKASTPFFLSFFGILLSLALVINAFIVLKKQSNSIIYPSLLVLLAVPVPLLGLYLYGFESIVLIYSVTAAIVFSFFVLLYLLTFLMKDPYQKYGTLRLFQLDFFSYIFPFAHVYCKVGCRSIT